MKKFFGLVLLAFLFWNSGEVFGGQGKAQDAEDPYGEQLGTVVFPVSCNGPAAAHAKRGLALMHHMTYEGARKSFKAAVESDPDCAMGYWGQAMSFIHPLWSDPPEEDEFQQGQALLEKAREQGRTTAWEQAYIEAAQSYYDQGMDTSEEDNLSAFEEGWQRVHEQFPDDPEAAVFYALAHLSTADPDDKSYVHQKRAAAIAREVMKQVPDHPGAHHYTIHAYDYPPLAEKALDVSRSYARIAPEVPHAMHMPSHIFTRLGLWQESIAMNRQSAEAALQHPAGNMISLHYPHALDYLAYAYLQRAEDAKAKGVLERLRAIEEPVQPHGTSAYTLAAVPARYFLERQEWAEAAALQPRKPAEYPWDDFPAMEAITHFAKAYGAARIKDEQSARQALDALTALRKEAAKSSAYWAKQVDIQKQAAEAWLVYEQGDPKQGLEMMRRAADLEATTEKHPITPGEILPASELLADMLLDEGQYQEAEKAYRTALERSPNRFNSLYGAGRAAELAGHKDDAALFYSKLVNVTADDATRERLSHARKYLETGAQAHDEQDVHGRNGLKR
ncbi:MAG: tetratricopeptide repeat protein [Desulfovibrionales bacterium]